MTSRRVNRYALEYGNDLREESRGGLLNTPRATQGEIYQATKQKLLDLKSKAFQIATFESSGFTKDGTYTGTGATITQADIDSLNPEQRAEYNGIQDAIAKIKDTDLSPEDFANLSDNQIDAIALRSSKKANNHSRWKQGFALVAGAAVADQVLTGGMGRQALGAAIGFEAPASISSGIDSITSAFGNVAGYVGDAAVNGINSLTDAGADYSKIMTAVAGLGLIAGGAAIGRSKGGAAGGLAGLALSTAMTVSMFKNSDIDADMRNNEIIGPYAGFAQDYTN